MYLNENFAKVYDHNVNDIVVLNWGEVYIQPQEGQDAVNAVLKAVEQNGKTKLLALINAESYHPDFLEWLVEEWYKKAYEAGLDKIAHKMGQEMYAQLSAEQVAYEDKSGIQFKNFYDEEDQDIIDWLLVG